MKDSFILYTEQKAVIDKLSDEQAGKLFKAIYEYVANDKIPQLDNLLDLVITPIKTALDKNKEKYEEVSQKRAQAGAKGGKQRIANQANANKSKQNIANQADNDNDNEYDNDNDNEKDIYTPSEVKTSSGDVAKASKHKYGDYKNVLLKDEELQALKRDFSNWEELIKYLDEYIEMKGYKAKSHYLAIRKWVKDAVKEKKPSDVKNKFNDNQLGNLSQFYTN